MPLFLAAFLGALIQAASSFVGRVLVSLGVGYVTYSGVSATLDAVRDIVMAHVSGAGAIVAGLLGTMQLDVVFGILVAASTARLVLNGLTSGIMKRMVLK